MAQEVNVARLLLAALGVFLAHQGSHYLDEAKGRHWNTKITQRMLYFLSFLFLTVGAAIGVYLSLSVSFLLSIFIVPLVFFPAAYSLELWKQKFHAPIWFGVSSALVCLGSFFLQTLTVSLFSALTSIGIGIQGTYIIILYEATKREQTRSLAWSTLKAIVLIWNLVALSMVAAKFA